MPRRFAKRAEIGFFVQRAAGDQDPVGADSELGGPLLGRGKDVGGRSRAHTVDFGKRRMSSSGCRLVDLPEPPIAIESMGPPAAAAKPRLPASAQRPLPALNAIPHTATLAHCDNILARIQPSGEANFETVQIAEGTAGQFGRALAVLEGRHVGFMSHYVVPAAIMAVAVVLVLGLINMMRGGNPNRSQKLMRLRVLLQFVAIIVIMATIWVMGR